MTYRVHGRAEGRRGRPLIITAHEPGRALAVGTFFGYERRNTIRLYPADAQTRSYFRGKLTDISIYDLRRA